MDFLFGSQKPEPKRKSKSNQRSFHLISIRETPKGRELMPEVEDMEITRQSKTPGGAARKFITLLCGDSKFSKKVKEMKKKKRNKCSYCITIKEVQTTPSGETSKRLEAVMRGGKEHTLEYKGVMEKDEREVRIGDEIVTFKTRVDLKAL